MQRFPKAALLFLSAWCVQCTPPAKEPSPVAATKADSPSAVTAADTAFQKMSSELFQAYFEQIPLGFAGSLGVALGMHQYDGRLPDDAPAALKSRAAFLAAALERLRSFPATELSASSRLERDVFVTRLMSASFELGPRRTPWRSPLYYLSALSLTKYVSRDYAPIDERARAVLAVCRAAGGYLATARANLDPSLPRAALGFATGQINGQIAFINKDVTEALAMVVDPKLKADVTAALAESRSAIGRLPRRAQGSPAARHGRFRARFGNVPRHVGGDGGREGRAFDARARRACGSRAQPTRARGRRPRLCPGQTLGGRLGGRDGRSASCRGNRGARTRAGRPRARVSREPPHRDDSLARAGGSARIAPVHAHELRRNRPAGRLRRAPPAELLLHLPAGSELARSRATRVRAVPAEPTLYDRARGVARTLSRSAAPRADQIEDFALVRLVRDQRGLGSLHRRDDVGPGCRRHRCSRAHRSESSRPSCATRAFLRPSGCTRKG